MDTWSDVAPGSLGSSPAERLLPEVVDEGTATKQCQTESRSGHASGPSGRISKGAGECRTLFKDYLKGQKRYSERMCELQDQFLTWANFLGVFAPDSVCLDAQLRGTPEIKELFLSMLAVLQRNLERGLRHHNQLFGVDVPAGDDAAMTGIKGSIERLTRLALIVRTPRRSTETERVLRWGQAQERDDFDEVALLLIQRCFATGTFHMSESLQVQLATSVAYRRNRLRYEARDQVRVTSDQSDFRRSSISASDPQPGLNYGAPKTHVSSLGSMDTSKSLWWPFSDTTCFEDLYLESSSHTTNPMSSHSYFQYPKAPFLPQGADRGLCTLCFKQLPKSVLQDEKSWRAHAEEDLKPYVCVSEECGNIPPAFTTCTEWQNHMKKTHGENWVQSIHRPHHWVCPLQQTSLCNFNTERDGHSQQGLLDHMKEQHSKDYPTAALAYMASIGKISEPLEPHICPFCGPEAVSAKTTTPASRTGDKFDSGSNPDPLDSSADAFLGMNEHIAEHLKSIATLSLHPWNEIPRAGLPEEVLEPPMGFRAKASHMVQNEGVKLHSADAKNWGDIKSGRVVIPPDSITKRRALLIGPGYTSLPGTEEDVHGMRQLLGKFGFDPIQELCGNYATRDNIIRALEVLIRSCTDGDAVVIYYSGYGGMVKRPPSSIAPDGALPSHIEYLIPSSFDHKLSEWNGIFNDEFAHYLFLISCRTQNITYVLDSCHSAGVAPKGIGSDTLCKAQEAHHKDYQRILQFKRKIKHQLVDESWSNPYAVRLSAASAMKAAFQHQTGTEGWRGVMTRHLIDSLQSNSALQEKMSWRNIMVEVAARVRHSRAYEQTPQEPRTAGPDTRIPFNTKQDRSKMFPAVIEMNDMNNDFAWVRINAGRVHGITSGCAFDLIPVSHDSAVQSSGQQGGKGQAGANHSSQAITEVCVKTLRAFSCEGITLEPKHNASFRRRTRAIARQRPGTKVPYKVMIAEDIEGLEGLKTAIMDHSDLVISEKAEDCDLHIQLSQRGSGKVELQGLLDGIPRVLVQLTQGNRLGTRIDNLLLAAGRLDAVRNLFQLSKRQDEDELLSTKFYIDIRKVHPASNQAFELRASYLVDNTSRDTFTTGLENYLSFGTHDKYQIVLKGLIDQYHFAFIFRIDAAGYITYVTRLWDDGIMIHEQMEPETVGRLHSSPDEEGIAMHWPPEVTAAKAVRESFVIVVTDDKAHLGSLETVAARAYYDAMARGNPEELMAALEPVTKFKLVRIDYELRPPLTKQDSTSDRMTDEKTNEYLPRDISPEHTAEFRRAKKSLASILTAERRLGGLRRWSDDIPPFVWVINAHYESVTVILKPLRLKEGMFSSGKFVNSDHREFKQYRKRLAPCSDSQRSRALFSWSTNRLCVISIHRGEEVEPFIKGDSVSAHKVYMFDNTPELRVQEADPMEVL